MLEMDGVYRQYAELICRFLFSLCRDAETARELTQETFYQAVRSAGRYDGSCKVSTWLCQIARHLWYQELERRSRRPGGRSRRPAVLIRSGTNMPKAASPKREAAFGFT